MKNSKKIFTLILLLSILIVHAQEFSKSSIKTGVGYGYNEGAKEDGLGFLYTIGYEKSFGEKERLRLNACLKFGDFSSSATDNADVHYNTTTVNINLNYDLIKYNSFSFFAHGGAFLSHSSGKLGTGGELNTNKESEYFKHLYLGGSCGIGFRINNAKSRFVYEIKPINIELGNNNYILGYAMVGVDIKLGK